MSSVPPFVQPKEYPCLPFPACSVGASLLLTVSHPSVQGTLSRPGVSNTAKHQASCLSAGPLRPCFSKMVNEKYPRLKNTLHGHSFYSSLLSREPFFFTASRNIFLIPSQNQESTYRKTGLSVSIYIPCCHPNGSQLNLSSSCAAMQQEPPLRTAPV